MRNCWKTLKEVCLDLTLILLLELGAEEALP